MCSSRGICGDNNRPNRSSDSEGISSVARYALCALAVGLIFVGIFMIVSRNEEDGNSDPEKTEIYLIVGAVMVGVGACVLLLSIILSVRSRKTRSNASSLPVATGVPLMNNVAREQEEAAAVQASHNVPSYEEVVGSGDYPVRHSNLRSSTSQLPSYEDIIAAVENEVTEPTDDPSEAVPPNDPTPSPAEPSCLRANPSMPTRSASRVSRLLRSLRVRRIKSDKLHLKDFRLQIRTPTQNPVTIEPITPPPQYDIEMPELG